MFIFLHLAPCQCSFPFVLVILPFYLLIENRRRFLLVADSRRNCLSVGFDLHNVFEDHVFDLDSPPEVHKISGHSFFCLLIIGNEDFFAGPFENVVILVQSHHYGSFKGRTIDRRFVALVQTLLGIHRMKNPLLEFLKLFLWHGQVRLTCLMWTKP